jgi:hypothetical protein
MTVEGERLICTNHGCGGEYLVWREPTLQNQNSRCACGSELKKYYHAPRLSIYSGETPAEIMDKLGQLKSQGC